MTYREFKKGDKIIIEYATRVSDPSMRSLLVYLLNLSQDEVRAAQDDPANQVFIQRLRHDRQLRQNIEALPKDKDIVPDALDLGDDAGQEDDDDLAAQADRQLPKRERKPVQRFSHDEFNANGGYKPRDKQTINYRVDNDDGDSDSESLYHDTGEPDDHDDGYVSGARQTETEIPLSLKSDRVKIRKLMRNEKQESERVRQKLMLLSLDPHKVYEDADLNKEATLMRALRLLYNAKQGLKLDHVSSVHIKVSAMERSFEYMANWNTVQCSPSGSAEED
jgi:hypothetical protein